MILFCRCRWGHTDVQPTTRVKSYLTPLVTVFDRWSYYGNDGDFNTLKFGCCMYTCSVHPASPTCLLIKTFGTWSYYGKYIHLAIPSVHPASLT